jgi:hypothetical protein
LAWMLEQEQKTPALSSLLSLRLNQQPGAIFSP